MFGTPNAISSNTYPDCQAFKVPNTKRKTPISAHIIIENGIACEACHGPGKSWVGVHTAELYFYEANITAGMFPTADATDRTLLCMSCHILGMGLSALLVLNAVFLFFSPAPTRKGQAIKTEIEGFKLYMEMAENL